MLGQDMAAMIRTMEDTVLFVLYMFARSACEAGGVGITRWPREGSTEGLEGTAGASCSHARNGDQLKILFTFPASE